MQGDDSVTLGRIYLDDIQIVIVPVVAISWDHLAFTVAQMNFVGKNVAPSQVRCGMAWVYDRYSRPDSPLYGEQAAAKEARRGL